MTVDRTHAPAAHVLSSGQSILVLDCVLRAFLNSNSNLAICDLGSPVLVHRSQWCIAKHMRRNKSHKLCHMIATCSMIAFASNFMRKRMAFALCLLSLGRVVQACSGTKQIFLFTSAAYVQSGATPSLYKRMFHHHKWRSGFDAVHRCASGPPTALVATATTASALAALSATHSSSSAAQAPSRYGLVRRRIQSIRRLRHR